MLTLLLFMIHFVHADSYPKVTVWSRNPDAVRKVLPKDYKILDGEDEERERHDSGYLLPSERAALFHKLKLEDALENLDDMDKDMLVMGARFEKLTQLKKYYPMLTEVQLRQLQKEVRVGQK